MKHTILILACLSCIFCSTQMKLNKSKEIDITVKSPVDLQTDKAIVYTIKNNTDKTYIIDPYGFIGSSYWTFNNERLNPVNFSKGYYSRDHYDCENDLIILKPKDKLDTTLVLNYHQKEIYDFSTQGKYVFYVKSNHSKQNGMPSSYKQYINDLEKKSYLFLNDDIDAKIPFVKK